LLRIINLFIGFTIILFILTSCTKSEGALTFEDVFSQSHIAYKQIIAKAETKDGLVVFYETEHGLNSVGFTSKVGTKYRDICGGGSISLDKMPEVTMMNSECSTESKGKAERFQMLSGAINNADIGKLEVQYKTGDQTFSKIAVILDTNKGYRVWFVLPDEYSKYHLEAISINGYSVDGKNVFKQYLR
jgi:hypothetical protein